MCNGWESQWGGDFICVDKEDNHEIVPYRPNRGVLFQAEIMGLNEKKFKRFNYLINNNNFLNELIKNVYSILKFVKEKKFNSIILNYDCNSENLFKWYQQLVAESLGK